MMPYLKSALAISIQLAAGWAAVKQLKALHKAVCILDQLATPPKPIAAAHPLSTHFAIVLHDRFAPCRQLQLC
jgi:hypothetical protein